MKNVYDQVQSFYRDELEWVSLIEQEWVEGFLRQNAWQGANDKKLTEIWDNLQMFILFLAYADYEYLDELSREEYSMAVEWMSVHLDEFQCNLKNVRKFFGVLAEFYHYLLTKKLIISDAELNAAAEHMAGGRRLRFIAPVINTEGDVDVEDVPLTEKTASEQNLPNPPAETVNRFSKKSLSLPEDIGKLVGESIERLMLKFSAYFQQEEFSEDFERALMLYNGPWAEKEETEEDDEFWLGFWDYFLFDYHLLSNDATPLDQFAESHRQRLNTEEKSILAELMSARFAVFYVSNVVNQEWVECVNLLTEETFRLPNPNFDYKKMKKMLFFGHIFFQEQELIMINFITSVEISTILRRRIQEEIQRLFQMFRLQNPQASWEAFLLRHANAVRHTVDLLVTWAKVNVTPYTQVEFTFPDIDELAPPHPVVVKTVEKYMRKFGYSQHDIELAQKLWHDFYQLEPVTVKKAATWAAAVIFSYAQINLGEEGIALEVIAGELKVPQTEVDELHVRMLTVLQLRLFDPRYLSEEGMISLMYHS
ncbi:MAG TPA: hypothetical protein VN611_06050 [Patescibacteria group bacterium]|nr:hypothetical protein [Patescibacteria group bacterium]